MKESWTNKKLGEVCTIERGGSPRPINEYITDDPNGLNWIKIGDAKEGSKYITSTKEKIKPEGLKKTRFVHKGDFILSNSMSFGKPYILDIDGCIHDGWLVIHDDNGTFDKSYLYYLLGSPNMYKEFQRLAVGGVVNNLNSEIVRNVVVPIPPIETQSRIVSELDLLQSIIDKQKAQLKELDNLAQAVFYDMFGDPVENEKGWEVKKLEEIISIPSRNGLTKPTAIRGTGVPMISMGELFANPIIKDSIKATLVPVSKKEIELSQIIRGDLLFARQSLSLEGAGKCSFVESCLQPTVFESHIIRIRVDNCVTHPRYVFYYFLSPYGKSEIRKRVYQVAAAGIKGSELIKIPIPIPPLSLQQSFVEKIEAIEQQKARISQSIAETQRLFDYTMDKYFG